MNKKEKMLFLGNAALARGLYEEGCSFMSSYPGTPSTEVTEEFAKNKDVYAEWAPNEKVALEAAFFAAISGHRAACAMKHVGLNVAADPLFTSSYIGVNAGLVIVVADDPGMHSSQNEQDSRHYAKAAKLPMLEPADSQEAKDFVRYAYEISEKFDTPVLLKMCTRVAHCQSIVELGKRTEYEGRAYKKDIAKNVMMPAMARRKHPMVEQRQRDVAEYAETSPLNFVDEGRYKSIGVITSSTCYQYVKEALGDKYPVLKLGMVNPLPERKITEFARQVKRLVVVEELDGFIEEYVKCLGLKAEGKSLFPNVGELSQNVIREKIMAVGSEVVAAKDAELPARPPALCAGCPHRGVFYTLKKLKLTVIGDIGCYTLGAGSPLSAMDTTVCMGASVSGIHGFTKLDPEAASRTVAVIGDSTFAHSGITGLVNIAYNASNSKVIVLDNSITGMTGHQNNPINGLSLRGEPAAKINLEELCHSIGIESVRVVDPYDLPALETVLKEELAKPCASVIIARRPCALLKSVKHKGAINADRDKCVGCKACMSVGCPALSMSGGRISVDASLCTGCGICTQVCKFSALGG